MAIPPPSFGQRLEKLEVPKCPSGFLAEGYRLVAEKEMGWAIAYVSVSGKFPDGSEGRLHAKYLTHKCVETLVSLEALCLVIDFSNASYRWGNSLLATFDALRKLYFYEWHDLGMDIPIKVVATERCDGLKTLLPQSMIFGDVDSALASCFSDLEVWAAD